MKKMVFLLFPLAMASGAAGTPGLHIENPLCGSSKETLKLDTSATFGQSDDNAPQTRKTTQELIKKDPEQAKTLHAKAKIAAALTEEAKKLKDAETVKFGQLLADHLETVARFQEGGNVAEKDLNAAYQDYRLAEDRIAQLKLRLDFAKRNTPEARKIREFGRAVANYRDRAEIAAKLCQYAEAEYYRTCARINAGLAQEYARNPAAETAARTQLKKARLKYLQDSARESAGRFRQRAEEMRRVNNPAKAEYYDKVVVLKEKMAEAYAKSDYAAARTLQKEYRKLQDTQPQ
ncbi:MAG: hypothetical protein PHV59_00385 [Victivallales bacterium]|nr:hypothetical protein [Victivallales bacterium]